MKLSDKKVYILKSTNFKRMNLYEVIEKNEVYFKKVALSNDLKLYGKTDLKKIKEALGITSYDTNEKVINSYEILRSGGSVEDVRHYLKTFNCSEKTVLAYISHAKNKLKNVFGESKDSIISLHLARYDKMFRDHISMTEDDFSNIPVKHVRLAVLCSKYIVAMDSLFAKEKVLGFHNKNFIVEINSFKKKKSDQFEEKLDFNGLSLEEQIELLTLVKKTKGIDTVSTQSEFVDFVDVTKEEEEDKLKVEVSNIKKTKVIKYKSIMELKENSLEEIKRKLQENLIKQSK